MFRLAALVALVAWPAAAEDWFDLEEYGRRIVDETYAYVGPNVGDPAMRYAGNEISCAQCHLDGGLRPGGLPLVRAYASYPAYVARSGRTETIEDRINDCMERSLNGRPLPEGSRELSAIVAYLRELGEDNVGFDPNAPFQPELAELDRPADPVRGAERFAQQCAACHGADGAGMRMGVPGDALGYRYPPLWGPGASNDGAGMARLTTVARFAHNDMPASAEAQPPRLRPEEAWDIAAHIVSKPRPAMAGLEKDYPDLLEKPVDTPYGPYADGFDREAHLFGPYGPIQARIAELKAAR